MSKPTILLDMKWENLESFEPFSAALTDFDLINWAVEAENNPNLDSVKYAIVWLPERGLLAKCPNLEVIFSSGAGVDHIFRDPELPELPIVRFVDPHLTGPMVEWVVLQVLLHVRQQRQYDAMQRKKEWWELPQPAAPKFRVGIMGFGELGQASASALLPLGFKINGWSQSQKQVDGVTSYYGADQLNEFLSNTDILVNLLPLTEQTRGILNADLISQLAKDGPFGAPVLINAGRGGSQNEHDIELALKEGRLRGASLDVFETEPLPKSSPLWNATNLVITPHAAAISDPDALAISVARQIKRYEAGQELEHLVDRSRGY